MSIGLDTGKRNSALDTEHLNVMGISSISPSEWDEISEEGSPEEASPPVGFALELEGALQIPEYKLFTEACLELMKNETDDVAAEVSRQIHLLDSKTQEFLLKEIKAVIISLRPKHPETIINTLLDKVIKNPFFTIINKDGIEENVFTQALLGTYREKQKYDRFWKGMENLEVTRQDVARVAKRIDFGDES